MDDTLSDDNYYSNSGARTNPLKAGCNFVGVYYPAKEKVLVKEM